MGGREVDRWRDERPRDGQMGPGVGGEVGEWRVGMKTWPFPLHATLTPPPAGYLCLDSKAGETLGVADGRIFWEPGFGTQPLPIPRRPHLLNYDL